VKMRGPMTKRGSVVSSSEMSSDQVRRESMKSPERYQASALDILRRVSRELED